MIIIFVFDFLIVFSECEDLEINCEVLENFLEWSIVIFFILVLNDLSFFIVIEEEVVDYIFDVFFI